uniref:Uncharacterized protein n=1 Tax=Romanomermis culicivorax TaxID=13658 RepID=A0A915HWF2_ROMCU
MVQSPQHQPDFSAPVHRPVSQIYDTYETSVLEKNETGSFYVPSSSDISILRSFSSSDIGFYRTKAIDFREILPILK